MLKLVAFFAILILLTGLACAQDASRNMAAVQCKLQEAALSLAAPSWARTLDIAQDQETKLRTEIANAGISADYANKLIDDLIGRLAYQEAEIARLKTERESK
jgi:diacylglycerol kinase family enzyme